MMDWLARTWAGIKQGQTLGSNQVRIPDQQVIGGSSGVVLQAEKDYFTIQVNEFFLDYTRQFWQQYTPSVWASAQFNYDGTSREVPFVIGPGLLGQPADKVPQGLLYRNTRIVGPVPYRGGQIALSVVISRIAASSHASEMLSVVESTASAFNVATALGPYLAIARSLGDGISAMLSLGSQPLVGVRDTLDPGVPGAAESRTGWYAILEFVPPEPLWVINRSLYTGQKPATAVPVRGTTFVLYSVTALDGRAGRNDVSQLPDLREQHQLAERLSAQPDKRSWTAARAVLADLGIRMRSHPDLTRDQGAGVLRTWFDEMTEVHQQAVLMASKGHQDIPTELAEAAAIVNDIMTQQVAADGY